MSEAQRQRCGDFIVALVDKYLPDPEDNEEIKEKIKPLKDAIKNPFINKKNRDNFFDLKLPLMLQMDSVQAVARNLAVVFNASEKERKEDAEETIRMVQSALSYANELAANLSVEEISTDLRRLGGYSVLFTGVDEEKKK